MKIYTKTGDEGKTGLFQGPRVDKNHPMIEAYGTVDELNSILGLIRSCKLPDDIDSKVSRVQNALFALGSDLATPIENKDVKRFSPQHTKDLENDIDQWDEILDPLKNFILPGGSTAVAYTHLARTVCRRAERASVVLVREQTIHMPCYEYLNRLSDWLFTLARTLNKIEGIKDEPWIS